MPLIVIPNVSEGRDRARITTLVEALAGNDLRVLDVHSDAVHNRTVFTATGTGDQIVAGAVALARAASYIDLTTHSGAHPRVGALDVFPIVPHEEEMARAVSAARAAARAVAHDIGLPVYLYGAAAQRAASTSLPDIRRGGLDELSRRAQGDMPPDFGPRTVDPRRGVVCVGARSTLIAFNVVVEGDLAEVTAVARTVRERGRTVGVRALAFATEDTRLGQVSMNLTAPELAAVDDAFALVEDVGVRAVATEIVGLVPERYLPHPAKKAARLLVQPSRSLEAALR